MASARPSLGHRHQAAEPLHHVEPHRQETLAADIAKAMRRLDRVGGIAARRQHQDGLGLGGLRAGFQVLAVGRAIRVDAAGIDKEGGAVGRPQRRELGLARRDLDLVTDLPLGKSPQLLDGARARGVAADEAHAPAERPWRGWRAWPAPASCPSPAYP